MNRKGVGESGGCTLISEAPLPTCASGSLLLTCGGCFPLPGDSTLLAWPSSAEHLVSAGAGFLSGFSLTTLLPWRGR